jgi:hypothetical protein
MSDILIFTQMTIAWRFLLQLNVDGEFCLFLDSFFRLDFTQKKDERE